MAGFTLLWGPTRLSADELPDLIEDEVRKVTVKAAALANGNTISAATATSETLTTSSVTTSGTTLTFTVTANQVGEHIITLAATLSDGEAASAYIRANVISEPCVGTRDYA